MLSYGELMKLTNELSRKKREFKQKELMKRQEADLKMDKDIRKRVNDHILRDLLEKTRNNEDPNIKRLHYQLKAYQNNSY
jgi:hypothetical protein